MVKLNDVVLHILLLSNANVYPYSTPFGNVDVLTIGNLQLKFENYFNDGSGFSMYDFFIQYPL